MLMRVTPARTRTTHVPGGPGCVVSVVHIAKEPLTDDAEAREAKCLEAVRIARDAILEDE